MSETQSLADTALSLDVLVIGAGISGINTAYRLQSQLPHIKFNILEGRNAIGGTWDLFKYPGIRSDSDLHTFGFEWHPWPHENPIAEGPLVISYLHDAVATHGLEKHIHFRHKVLSANWSSKSQRWTVVAEHDGHIKSYTARFLILGTGYFDYDTPLKTETPGLQNFKGKIIHPQMWPEDYDYSNKKMVIIGSGATAVTLLPNLMKKAASVTMLQRSPTYIIARTNRSPAWLREFVPRPVLSVYERLLFMTVPYLFYVLCMYFPNMMRAFLRQQTINQLPQRISFDPHFKPLYNPWEQRMCLAPDGDFYQALHDPRANIVTSRIKTVTEHEIHLLNGRTLEADVIITATGLRVMIGGGISLTVDGEKVNIADKMLWNGTMIQDIPNMFYMIGYTNASWTLGADNSAFLFVRMLKHMAHTQATVLVSRKPQHMDATQPVFTLTSTYMRKAYECLPKCGTQRPWTPRTNPVADHFYARWGSFAEGVEFTA
ncbi:putative flavin-binding monooxygenase [Pseudomassariella vexata]|uniref:Putative flavin-binding monooxygenase n=1 Tax=Pseudomassariella vexata TaxID=1141098 RepID=A0A1Y2EJ20_9PEZI|nr:putative flavin-binding monooxygenase [Pseudomassariella vexata]ORY71457.1 putative flavin-binding monooxygenase [Pseudomassariella vexata]